MGWVYDRGKDLYGSGSNNVKIRILFAEIALIKIGVSLPKTRYTMRMTDVGAFSS